MVQDRVDNDKGRGKVSAHPNVVVPTLSVAYHISYLESDCVLGAKPVVSKVPTHLDL